MPKACLVLVALWAALATCHLGGHDSEAASLDNVDVDAFLKPDMKDPVNVMKRNIRTDLHQAEAGVERDLPNVLTSADAALDHMTEVAAQSALKRQAVINAKLMKKHQVPDSEAMLGLDDGETREDIEKRNEEIREEVLNQIDPNMRASLRRADPPSMASYDGMRSLIHNAMENRMAELGESEHQRDTLGEGIEKLVSNKKRALNHNSAAVDAQLKRAQQKLAEAQDQMKNGVELLQENESKMIEVQDKSAFAAKKKISDAEVPYTHPNPYVQSVDQHRNSTIHQHKGNFSAAELSAEVEALHSQKLNAEDEETVKNPPKQAPKPTKKKIAQKPPAVVTKTTPRQPSKPATI